MYDPFCICYNISLNVLFYVCVEILACEDNRNMDAASAQCPSCTPYCRRVAMVDNCYGESGMLKLIMRSSLLDH